MAVVNAGVRLDVADGGAVRVTAPVGWADAAEREALRAALDAVRPTLARLAALPLPPRPWPAAWEEFHAEREAIAAEGGAPDPSAVAAADLRVAVARRELVADGE